MINRYNDHAMAISDNVPAEPPMMITASEWTTTELRPISSPVGILPGHDAEAANDYADVVIPTGLDIGRNSVVVHSDAVIIIGGSAGTLSEIAMAWSLYRLIIGFRVEGWSGKLADKTVDDRDRYPEIENDRVDGVDNADEALALLKE
jgi:hypothetical protein